MSAVRTFHDGIRRQSARSRLPGWAGAVPVRVAPVRAVPAAGPLVPGAFVPGALVQLPFVSCALVQLPWPGPLAPARPLASAPRSAARGMIRDGTGMVDAALRRQPHDCLKVVRRGYPVPPLVAAGLTAVEQDGSPGAHLHRDRTHRPRAVGGPIAGVDVHVPGPQAARAVVGVAVAAHRRPAGKAAEVLGGTGEATGHRMTVTA